MNAAANNQNLKRSERNQSPWAWNRWWRSAAVALGSGVMSLHATPTIINQPADFQGQIGGQATFMVLAAGDGPLLYQWRLNGVNIPGAVDNQFSIFGLELSHGGSYTVAIQDQSGAILSAPALLRFAYPNVGGGDDFGDSTFLQGDNLTVSGKNFKATRESGEPLHGGKGGVHSVWYVWNSPYTGIATLDTKGSGFDTLLGVYQGPNLAQLVTVAGDDDSGGAHTSQVQFNTVKAGTYYIAVDGLGDDQGDFLLSLNATDTDDILPVIVRQPESQTVREGETVIFRTTVSQAPSLSFQWYFQGQPLAGQTETSLTISNVKFPNVGQYVLEITVGNQYVVRSRPATLEIGPIRNVQSVDKVGELLSIQSLQLGLSSSLAASTSGSSSFFSPAVGTIIGQTINNTNDGGDPIVSPHCGIIGGADRWITLTPTETGICQIDTEGSTIDTVIAVYLWTGSLRSTLESPVDCNNDIESPPSLQSRVQFSTAPGATYWVALDGRYAARGVIQFNLRFGLPPQSSLTDPPPDVHLRTGDDRRLESEFQPNPFPPQFQWFRDGTVLAGSESSHLLLEDVHLDDSGVYSVRASNWAGFTAVNVARILVNTMTIEDFRIDSSRRATFTVRGELGQFFAIEATTDFMDWETLAEDMLRFPDPVFRFIDSAVPPYPHRFYRLRPMLP